MSKFRGIDRDVARTSIPGGFHQELINVDNTNTDRARHRQGLVSLSRDNLLTEDIVTSGELIALQAEIPTSGLRTSGVNSITAFPTFTTSGIYSLGSGEAIVPPWFSHGTNLINFAQDNTSGFYNLRPNDYVECAAGLKYSEGQDGVWDLDNYVQQVECSFASGFYDVNRAGVVTNPGLALFIDPQNEGSYYFCELGLIASATSYFVASFTVFKVASGVLQAQNWGPVNIFATDDSLINIPVKFTAEKISDTAVDLKVYVSGTLQLSASDTVAPTTSGLPGIFCRLPGTVPGLDTGWHPYSLSGVKGGTNAPAQVQGGLDASQPSGYASAIVAQTAHGKLHYQYVDASGNFILLESPVGDD